MPVKLTIEAGTRYGRLTIVEEVEPAVYGTKYKRQFLCLCDCGNSARVLLNHLRSGNTISCGCYNIEQVIQRFKKENYGKIVATVNGDIVINSAATFIFAQYKRSAKERRYAFALPFDLFIQLTQMSCYYCGSPPSNKGTKGKLQYIYSGIDRVDNTRGYEVDNTVPCCKICNIAKEAMSQQAFVDYIKTVYTHLQSKGLV